MMTLFIHPGHLLFWTEVMLSFGVTVGVGALINDKWLRPRRLRHQHIEVKDKFAGVDKKP